MARKLPKHIEYWEDSRWNGDGIIVTLHYGYSFEHKNHEGIRGFDTVSEARRESALKNVYPCRCEECKKHLGGAA